MNSIINNSFTWNNENKPFDIDPRLKEAWLIRLNKRSNMAIEDIIYERSIKFGIYDICFWYIGKYIKTNIDIFVQCNIKSFTIRFIAGFNDNEYTFNDIIPIINDLQKKNVSIISKYCNEHINLIKNCYNEYKTNFILSTIKEDLLMKINNYNVILNRELPINEVYEIYELLKLKDELEIYVNKYNYIIKKLNEKNVHVKQSQKIDHVLIENFNPYEFVDISSYEPPHGPWSFYETEFVKDISKLIIW